ncbi:MFS transporter [Achromobacter sp. B7]|uniref:MFS transporter n=1 Tax=Achromobacter sp. B7 TaxID=2282475 RepID=UPI000E72879A|nr:MFS transporter [Achromobacter sp. B7]AYD64804.1 MFS transporter [Achromobacter sp. B7]
MSSTYLNAWRVAAIILVGLNLRPVLASVPPLLDRLQAAIALSDSAAGLLTALPVLVMGLGALSVAPLRRMMREHHAIAVGVALVMAATACRLWAHEANLMLLTGVIAGLGIAVTQALLPYTIKAQFSSGVSAIMGLYSTAIMGGAAVASVASPVLAERVGWPQALAAWSVPAAAALLCWLLVHRVGTVAPLATDATKAAKAANAMNPTNATKAANATNAAGQPASGRSHRWLLAVFFGLGTGAYTLVLAWLPPYYTALGWTPVSAGQLLGAVTVAEIVAGLLVSAAIGRLRDRRVALFAAVGLLTLGLLGLIFAPVLLAWPAAVLAGLGIGALFPLSLIVTMDHASTPAQAGRLASFVQGVGYLIAALFPFVAGVIRQHLSGLRPAWMLMAGICLILFAIAARLRPPHGNGKP